MKQRKPTEGQKAAAAERRARFRELALLVSEMSEEERQAIIEKVGAIPTCEGRMLSPFNTCLLVSQAPTCSMVGGFQQWIKAGRVVRKGERGLGIWIPKTGKEDSGAEPKPGDAEKPNFIMGTVFDVSQTQEIETARAMAA